MKADNPLSQDLDLIAERSEEVLRSLAGERIFITGGTGFIGTWVLEALAWANARLDLAIRATVLTRAPESFLRKVPHLAACPELSFHRGDARDFLFPAGGFAAVIHGAASSDNAWNVLHTAELVTTIVCGTHHVLEFARVSGARRFLFLSSGAVYGQQPAQLDRVNEDYAGAPPVEASVTSAYGQAKRTAEVLTLLSAAQGLGGCVARAFASYGPHLPLDRHFAIGNFIGQAAAGGPVVVRGDGTAIRSYLYAADLVVWLLAALLRGKSGRAYNVGSDEPISVGDLARLVAESADPHPEVRISAPRGLGAPDRYVPDVALARKELGVRQHTSLREGISRTLTWVRRTGAAGRGTH